MNPTYYAFFDVDGTVLKGVSMMDFLEFYFDEKYSENKILSKLHYQIYKFKAWFVKRFSTSREKLNRFYYRCYKNQCCHDLNILAHKWFEFRVKSNPKAYKENIVSELKTHQKNGAEVVFVSGSFEACLLPIAKELGVKNILSTEMISCGRDYTGEINYPMIGEAKAKAILGFLEKRKFKNLSDCYAYGDHHSDLFMLQMVGNPRVVQGDKSLESWAKEKNIPILK